MCFTEQMNSFDNLMEYIFRHNVWLPILIFRFI